VWIVALILLAAASTSASAAPLYLKCEGKVYGEDPSHAERVTQSIRIDGTNVWFEGVLASIISDDGDVWTFGSGTTTRVTVESLNRITGQVEISFLIKLKNGRSLGSHFEGVCHKTEKLF
jgi:hypothetical protein